MDYASTEAADKAFGVNQPFSWTAFAAQAVGEAVGQEVAQHADNFLNLPAQPATFGQSLEKGFIGAYASAAGVAMADNLIGHTGTNYAQLGVQAFGNSLGQALASVPQQEAEQQAQADEKQHQTLTQQMAQHEATQQNGLNQNEQTAAQLTAGMQQINAEMAQVNQDAASLQQDEAILNQPLQYTAQAGDSISTILGTSDPGAIGAFMQANELTGSTIQAGQTYSVPVTGNYTDSQVQLGQMTLNSDNVARMAKQINAEGQQIDTAVKEEDILSAQLNRDLNPDVTGTTSPNFRKRPQIRVLA